MDHLTTNKDLLQDFAALTSKQLFGSKRRGLTFKDFIDVAEQHQYWFIRPHLIREEFLVYALQNPDKALAKVRTGDQKLFADVQQSLASSSSGGKSLDGFRFNVLRQVATSPANNQAPS